MAEIAHKVEIDGAEHELTLDTEALGVVTKDEIAERYVPRDHIEDMVGRRVGAAKKGLYSPEQIAENDDVFSDLLSSNRDRALKVLGVDPDAQDVDVDKLRESVRKSEVEPLARERDEAVQQVNALRRQQLRSDVVQASSDLGVRDDIRPLLGPYYEDATKFDPEFNGWFIVGPDGEFEYSARTLKKGEAPWKTVEEDLAEKRDSGEHDKWFEAKGKPGIGARGTKAGPSGPPTLEEFKAMAPAKRTALFRSDPETYRKLTAELADENERKLVSA